MFGIQKLAKAMLDLSNEVRNLALAIHYLSRSIQGNEPENKLVRKAFESEGDYLRRLSEHEKKKYGRK